MLPCAGATAVLLLGAATVVFFPIHLNPGAPAAAMLLVVLPTNVLGDALVGRLAARRAAR
jgi:hypothetical protein